MGYWDKKQPVQPEQEEAEITTLEEFEAACAEDMGDIEKGFRSRMKAENKRFRDMCDTEYWFCVCFTSRAQKEEFLGKIGIDTGLKYIDGKEMAKAYRKAINTPDMEFARIRPFDKEYLNRAAELEETHE